MTDLVEKISVEEVHKLSLPPVVVLCSKSVRDRVESIFDFPIINSELEVDEDTKTVIVVGGGSLIDQTKIYCKERGLDLVAVPSIWGSGAEVSPVAVYTDGVKKLFYMDEKLKPRYRCIVPEMAETIPDDLAKYGCGDSWSHVLEGSISPLSDEENSRDGANLIREMLAVRTNQDPIWFELSARACLIQSSSSVGLIHSIAHTLEPILHQERPKENWGHSKLCSILTWPVYLKFIKNSTKWKSFADKYNINESDISAELYSFFEVDEYDSILDQITENWKEILRHPFTRTNSCVIRRNDICRFSEVMH